MEKNASFIIADIGLELTGQWPCGALDAMENYRTESPAEAGDILRIACRQAEEISARELDEFYGVRHIIEEYGRAGETYVSQDRSGDGSLATALYSPDFRRVRCELVDVEARGGADIVTRTRVALGRCVLNCLPTFGAVTFHSSAIAYKGQALLYAAPSGTGKSTQTGLWRRYYPEETVYINDDTPILRRKNGRFHAFGSPWAGTSGINGNISAPLRAIIYVKRGTENALRPIEGAEKIIRALRSVREQMFPEPARLQNELIFELMEETPVYELTCDMSQGAVEAVKSRLFGQKRPDAGDL